MKITALAFLLVPAVSAFAPNAVKPAFATSGSSLYSALLDEAAVAPTKTKAPVFDEVCDTTGVTLTRFMSEVAMLNPELQELTTLFGAIDTACKAISNMVKRSQLPSSETLGYEGNVNIQGEDQKVSKAHPLTVKITTCRMSCVFEDYYL
jgi:fructose-1,6-bisphosphatase I